MAECIESVGFGFMFAPNHHRAMRHVVPVRKELAVRTVFNLLGPLTNPAGAMHQVIGVSDAGYLEKIAAALGELGTESALVVSSADGLDEFSASGPTRVVELKDGLLDSYEVSPGELGVEPVSDGAVAAGEPDQNAEVTRAVLRGEPGTERSLVVLNAGAAIYVGGGADTIEERRAPRRAGDRRRRGHRGAGALRGAHPGGVVNPRLESLVNATRDAVERRKRERPLSELEREAARSPRGGRSPRRWCAPARR